MKYIVYAYIILIWIKIVQWTWALIRENWQEHRGNKDHHHSVQNKIY